jgi:hypothetical protein
VNIYSFFIPRIEFQVASKQTVLPKPSAPQTRLSGTAIHVGGTQFRVSSILTHNEFHFALSRGSRKFNRLKRMPLETTEKDGRTLQKADRINKIAELAKVSRWYRDSRNLFSAMTMCVAS